MTPSTGPREHPIRSLEDVRRWQAATLDERVEIEQSFARAPGAWLGRDGRYKIHHFLPGRTNAACGEPFRLGALAAIPPRFVGDLYIIALQFYCLTCVQLVRQREVRAVPRLTTQREEGFT